MKPIRLYCVCGAKVEASSARRMEVEFAYLAKAEPEGESRPAAIDAAYLARQREWSERTFGPGLRTIGILDHIAKEFEEIVAEPTSLEWIDVVILALDGAWRAGHEPQAIIDAIVAKQARNESRTWPDWRTMPPNKAIEHVREGASALPDPEVTK